MSSLCAIAFPQIEDQLRRTLADLSGHGMLDPIVLVTDTETTLLDAGELTPIDLDQFLATQKLDELVLIAISLADGDALRLPLDIGDQAARLRQRCAAAGIDFRATSLVVPAETTPIPVTALHADWEANVILVPEDSAGSRGMTATALSPSDVPFVAASAAATLGGAWSWMTAPPMATETIRYVQGERSAYLARLTLRLVDGGDIAAKLVGWALDPSGSWPVPDGCTVHPNAPGAVADLAEAISAAPEVRFSYRPLPEEPTVPRRRIGLLAALRLFFSRLWVHLRKLPALSMRQARASASEAVHQFAQAQTFGESELVIGPRSGPSDVGSIADSRTRIARLSALPHLRVDSANPNSRNVADHPFCRFRRYRWIRLHWLTRGQRAPVRRNSRRHRRPLGGRARLRRCADRGLQPFAGRSGSLGEAARRQERVEWVQYRRGRRDWSTPPRAGPSFRQRRGGSHRQDRR